MGYSIPKREVILLLINHFIRGDRRQDRGDRIEDTG
jgi:hypothetical protein